MDTNTIIELGKSLSEAKELQKELHNLKLEKANLEREIGILKKDREQEQKDLIKFKGEKANEKKEIAEIIQNLQSNRASLSSSVVPEIEKLNLLKEQIDSDTVKLNEKQKRFDGQVMEFTKTKINLEEKKNILNQIKKLIETL